MKKPLPPKPPNPDDPFQNGLCDVALWLHSRSKENSNSAQYMRGAFNGIAGYIAIAYVSGGDPLTKPAIILGAELGRVISAIQELEIADKAEGEAE